MMYLETTRTEPLVFLVRYQTHRGGEWLPICVEAVDADEAYEEAKCAVNRSGFGLYDLKVAGVQFPNGRYKEV